MSEQPTFIGDNARAACHILDPAAELARLRAELAALRARVEALEGGAFRTADRKIVHRDMPVYVITDDDGIQVDCVECRIVSYDAYTVELAYSTRKAAEDAMESKDAH